VGFFKLISRAAEETWMVVLRNGYTKPVLPVYPSSNSDKISSHCRSLSLHPARELPSTRCFTPENKELKSDTLLHS